MNNSLYIQDMYPLFEAVQKEKIFVDQKTMADAIPLFPITEIMEKYKNKNEYSKTELQTFIEQNFKIHYSKKDEITNDKAPTPIDEHIENLWDELTRTSDDNHGSLLKLPFPYIVPGGRFEEFFYWDSYFIMLGLQVSNRIEMMENIVANCSYLIEQFGFVPNANRTYFLSRSQPPYFSLMLDLIYESTNDKTIYAQYFKTMEKEYSFWMDGCELIENESSYKHIIKTINGDIINRYYDAENTPRPESFMIDIQDAKKTEDQSFFRNIRSACESGWDFSSRWFQDKKHITTIQTLNISPIDLNCLLWHLESTLGRIAEELNLKDLSSYYINKASKRQTSIKKYFWDQKTGLYKDYLYKEDMQSTSETIACLYPLFLGICTQEQAKLVAENINEKFLKDGGLITTTADSGQQWDSPNAWAPYQWIGYKSMKNYGFDSIAEKIKENWCNNVERVYNNTHKLMEKYNAIDTKSLAGGGEYPNQDGFGWTNAVYIRLKNL